MNYYKRNMGDYARDTGHLSLAEDGAYNRMLDFYYASEKPLPKERAEIYRRVRARSKADQAAVDTCLRDFFEQRDDGWHHKRCDEEIAVMQHKADTNRENGKSGGRPKKKPSDNPQKTHSVSSGNPPLQVVETLAISHKPLGNSKEAAAPPADPLWGEALGVLTAAGNGTETARRFVGMCLKDWSADDVTDAILEARGTADPKAYALKLLAGKEKKRGRGSADPTAGAV